MNNKYDFLPGDYVIEFESPLLLTTTMKWFSKNCFNKHHISYEFATQPMPKNARNNPNNELELFNSPEDLFQTIPNNLTVEAVALHSAPLSRIRNFVNVIKSTYKIKKQYLVFGGNCNE